MLRTTTSYGMMKLFPLKSTSFPSTSPILLSSIISPKNTILNTPNFNSNLNININNTNIITSLQRRQTTSAPPPSVEEKALTGSLAAVISASTVLAAYHLVVVPIPLTILISSITVAAGSGAMCFLEG
eukprot:Tbor_TRINITY_DN5187_c6_g1::TRINITY_DN5187_c6_g1_i1::g.25604::m.25604